MTSHLRGGGEKKDDVQKECNVAWDQLKKNNPTDEGLTEATNKKIEELRRQKMKFVTSQGGGRIL